MAGGGDFEMTVENGTLSCSVHHLDLTEEDASPCGLPVKNETKWSTRSLTRTLRDDLSLPF